MKKALLLLSLLLVLTSTCSAKHLVTIEHTVASGETLQTLAEQYITPDRYLPEFKEGIVELNYDEIFAHRCEVRPGDIIKINIWKN